MKTGFLAVALVLIIGFFVWGPSHGSDSSASAPPPAAVEKKAGSVVRTAVQTQPSVGAPSVETPAIPPDFDGGDRELGFFSNDKVEKLGITGDRLRLLKWGCYLHRMAVMEQAARYAKVQKEGSQSYLAYIQFPAEVASDLREKLHAFLDKNFPELKQSSEGEFVSGQIEENLLGTTEEPRVLEIDGTLPPLDGQALFGWRVTRRSLEIKGVPGVYYGSSAGTMPLYGIKKTFGALATKVFESE